LGKFRFIKNSSSAKESKDPGRLRINILFGILLFIFLMSPLFIFDLRHGWNNYSSMKRFFTERQTTVSARPWTAIPKAHLIFQNTVTRIVAGKDTLYGKYLTYLFDAATIFILYKLIRFRLKTRENKALFLIFLWLGFAILGLGLYKQTIYDHYFGFFYPGLFILLGYIIQNLYQKTNQNWKILAVSVILMTSVIDLINTPIRFSPNYQMQRAQSVADFILKESGNKKLNLAVIAQQNYEDGYQYFLEKMSVPVLDIDPLKLNETVADQLFVVCEMQEEKCDPTHSPKSEVANFGWSKIENKWEVKGVIVYKLIHTK